MKTTLLYTPAEVAELFRHPGDLKFVYRNARPGVKRLDGTVRPHGFLYPAARKCGRKIYFLRAVIDPLIGLPPS